VVRRKLLPRISGKPRPDSPDDYVVYVTTRFVAADRYFGELSLIRTTDGRKLYPFDGAPSIGPFCSMEAAREAASVQPRELILADLANPE
jgi:hypothetical protein